MDSVWFFLIDVVILAAVIGVYRHMRAHTALLEQIERNTRKDEEERPARFE